MDNINFEYYNGDIRSPVPLGNVSLSYMINAIINPRDNIKLLLDKISVAPNRKIKGELKQQLVHFTPCVITKGGRSYANIESFTGLLVLDFDHIDNAEWLRDELYERYKFIIASWVSPSRKGVKCLVSIPVSKTVSEFKSYYWGLYDEIKEYDGLDTTGQNPVLPLFISYDYELRYREDFSLWSTKGKNKNEFIVNSDVVIKPFIANDNHKRNVVAIVESIMAKAYGNGHPTVVKGSLVLGGYVGYGYIQQTEAFGLMDSLIDGNEYLRQKHYTYKKTARKFITDGMRSPLELK